LHGENFGDVLYVEVGATFVGSIIQTYDCDKAVKKDTLNLVVQQLYCL